MVRPLASGRATHCLLQINDVTVSVTRERVLRERQNARYHAIVDTAPDAIITMGLDRTIQWLNGAAEHVFGYAPADLLGQEIDILLERDGDLAGAFVGDGVGGKYAESFLQVIGRRKQGRSAYFDVSFARWRADERVFVTTIWRDVTARMAAEAGASRKRKPPSRVVGGAAATGVDLRPRRRMRLLQSAMAGIHRGARARASGVRMARSHS